MELDLPHPHIVECHGESSGVFLMWDLLKPFIPAVVWVAWFLVWWGFISGLLVRPLEVNFRKF